MITEDYVSFEVARLLKDKGFDEHCFCINYPLPEGGHHNIILPNLLNNSIIPFTDEYKFCRYKEDFITIPTLQIAMKWLREVHKVHIIAEPCLGEGSEPNLSFNRWFWTILKEEGEYKPIRKIDEFSTYEQACEAAIKYCLENLI